MPEFYLNKNKQQDKAKNYTNHTFLLAAVAAMKADVNQYSLSLGTLHWFGTW
jgi:hypothetical protein